MRLLAHGGTSYSERHRIGVWPAVSRDTMESTYGLPGDAMIYGLGVLEDCLPFIILRRRQVIDAGRSYAYSLLLDPGREVWEKFRWNAAGLIRALLADDFSNQLLNHPESCTEESLRQSLAALAPETAAPPDTLGAARAEVFRVCLVGAAFDDEAVAVRPDSLGFAERPQPGALAHLLEGVAQSCFRAGSGWLVGGSREHGLSLGARFVIDDGAGEGDATLSELARRGREILEAWGAIASDEEFKNVLRGLEGVPLCEWPCGGGAASDRLLMLAQFLGRRQPPPEELLRSMERRLQGTPFLAQDIRRAAHRLALQGSGPVARAQSALLVRNYFEHGFPLPAHEVERLDTQTLIKLSVDYERQGGGGAYIPLPLPRETRFEVFMRTMGAADGYRHVPALLSGAYNFVIENFSAQERDERIQRLLEAVEQHTLSTSDSLDVWGGFAHAPHPLWPQLAEILRGAATNRAQSRPANWAAEYIRFAQDPGGSGLSAMFTRGILGQAEAGEVVRRCLTEFTELGSAAAADWLAALCDSPLRRVVHIDDKIAVANSGVNACWRPLLALWCAYFNLPSGVGPDDPRLPLNLSAGTARDRARKVLCDDLRQMLREKPPTRTLPDLTAVKRLLGGLPADVIEALTGLRPRHQTSHSLAFWASGLLEIGADSAAADQIIDFILNSEQPLPEGWLFDGFEKKKLEELAVKLLFSGFSVDDDRRRRRCQEILGDERVRAHAGKLFERLHKEYVKADESSGENFLRRYAWHEDALDALFACFSEPWRKSVVRQLYAYDADEFIRRARKILDEAEADKSPLPPFRLAVLQLINSRNETQLRKKFVGPLSLLSERMEILNEVLKRGESRELPQGHEAVSPPAPETDGEWDETPGPASDEADFDETDAAPAEDDSTDEEGEQLDVHPETPRGGPDRRAGDSSLVHKVTSPIKRLWRSLLYSPVEGEPPRGAGGGNAGGGGRGESSRQSVPAERPATDEDDD